MQKYWEFPTREMEREPRAGQMDIPTYLRRVSDLMEAIQHLSDPLRDALEQGDPPPAAYDVVAARWREAYHSFAGIAPPAQYRKLHAVLRAMLQECASASRDAAEAMQRSDIEQAKRATSRLADGMDRIDEVYAELERARGQRPS